MTTRVPPAPALLVSVFVIGTCGLIYELLAGTLASYVLGDSVTQFSTIIGVYLFAMGAGAWLSGFVETRVVARFIEVEVGVALLGGSSAALLFLSFAHLSFFRVVLYGLVFVIGTLVGLEIPLLMRILRDRYELKDLVARVLTADYLGALLASLAFPIFIVPRLGLVRGSFAVGCLNAVVAVWCTYLLADALRPGYLRWLRAQAYLVLGLLSGGFYFADFFTTLSEDRLYADPIVHAQSTAYQRIIVTRGRGGFQLFLNGHLQFSSADEHRYHEALVHPAFAVAAEKKVSLKRVVLMGGGDGLALREVLKYPQVEQVVLVDLDPEMTRLAAEHPFFIGQNRKALADPRVQVVAADAMIWLRDQAPGLAPWDLMIADFPDPNSFSLGKLYTTRFYRLARRALADNGLLVVQSTSPLYARRSFWCINTTIAEAGFSVLPYHAAVPSFGEWGFVLASKNALEPPNSLPVDNLAFLTAPILQSLFHFPVDMGPLPSEPNRLDNQVLVQLYEDEWGVWN